MGRKREGRAPAGIGGHANLHAGEDEDEVQLGQLRISGIVLLTTPSQSHNVVAGSLLQRRNCLGVTQEHSPGRNIELGALT